eukprot:1141077-Pelagomonas_calceolata.AAC.2
MLCAVHYLAQAKLLSTCMEAVHSRVEFHANDERWRTSRFRFVAGNGQSFCTVVHVRQGKAREHTLSKRVQSIGFKGDHARLSYVAGRFRLTAHARSQDHTGTHLRRRLRLICIHRGMGRGLLGFRTFQDLLKQWDSFKPFI